TLEAELWPNRIAILAAAGIPVTALGARMSARGQNLWRRFPKLSAKLLNAIAYLQPQDAGSYQRFKGLGIDPEKMGPVLNWKSLYQPQTIDLDPKKRRNICLAASTHPGEDEIILKAFGLVRQTWPELQLIIAPRHPKRGAEIADLILSQGWRLQRYSQDQASGPEKVDVILADTLGEMPKWYAASGLCIVGGAFKDHGGHTPYEPAAYECALITGPHTRNFSAEYETLALNKAAIRAADAEALAKALSSLKTPSAQQNLAQRATKALSHDTDMSIIMDVLEHLMPRSNTDLA
ncbi:MAG TPA: 3-deoxy-D-manno-octulosonic acid transferase, partial [Rhodobacteraceae bacterium]|nr:3-deoxy-D-manno-octulosonic acid transferase [Paracoccaceae bacterium]